MRRVCNATLHSGVLSIKRASWSVPECLHYLHEVCTSEESHFTPSCIFKNKINFLNETDTISSTHIAKSTGYMYLSTFKAMSTVYICILNIDPWSMSMNNLNWKMLLFFSIISPRSSSKKPWSTHVINSTDFRFGNRNSYLDPPVLDTHGLQKTPID